jgi:hypothetical protein
LQCEFAEQRSGGIVRGVGSIPLLSDFGQDLKRLCEREISKESLSNQPNMRTWKFDLVETFKPNVFRLFDDALCGDSEGP